MRYLLDVSALVAAGVQKHEFFEQVVAWFQELSPEEDEFATCAITEIGFVRVLGLPQYGLPIEESKAVLQQLKASSRIAFSFIADDQDASRLPRWVKMPKQVADGHLAQLAKANGAVLATLDRGIPGAFVIPEES
ncbi:MAG TPA: PIN domain-containing protein [Candidatus Acidoferrum sp.]|nr:PIN domain-containing protein [Candidatus Acidoferrum sp.]